MKTKHLVLTAVLLAMCIVFQSMKGISVYLTGSAVNAILVMATLAVGTSSGIFIAVMSPIIAYFMGFTPIMQLVPLMIFVVMLGNLTLVLLAGKGRKEKLAAWLALGAILKAVVLWLLVWYAVIPFFGGAIPEKMVGVVKATFSMTQFITAAIGCSIAFVIHTRVKHLYVTE
ncbi:ECF transporter S component [Anaerotignum propionicum]|uniref:ECF transporter S component n=1 Tax=Anaerotignum propionicum TaxID=28446 RepID=UPI00210A3A66|nr:ECF transporter S component [Anaerotignum propionicum]MCQ4935078.1 ECF transporter S component [Anaerotignum propionicum]